MAAVALAALVAPELAASRRAGAGNTRWQQIEVHASRRVVDSQKLVAKAYGRDVPRNVPMDGCGSCHLIVASQRDGIVIVKRANVAGSGLQRWSSRGGRIAVMLA